MKVKSIIILLISVCLLSGCATEAQKEALQNQINELTIQKQELEKSIQELQSIEDAEKIRTGTAIYVVKINVSQKHTILDLDDMIKDAMNDIDIELPVSEDFYNSVEKGTVLDDSFRLGSFIMSGSLGKWNVTIKDKYIR